MLRETKKGQNKMEKTKKTYIITGIVITILIGVFIILANTKEKEPGLSESIKNVIKQIDEENKELKKLRDAADRLERGP